MANDLVTMMLSEDVRSRTEFAAQTTKFLAQEVTRLEERLASIDAQIIALKKTRLGGCKSSDLDGDKALATLEVRTAAQKRDLLGLSSRHSGAEAQDRRA